jgi:hypothetical protein
MRFVPAVAAVVGVVACVVACVAAAGARPFATDPELRAAFLRQGIRLAPAEVEAIRGDVELAVREARAHGIGNSKVDFAAVEVATRLGLDTSPGSNARPVAQRVLPGPGAAEGIPPGEDQLGGHRPSRGQRLG